METIADQLASGFALHQQGDLAAAEKFYRKILTAEPNHVEAQHLLGLVTLNTNRLAESILLLERAAAAGPRVAVYFVNLGSAYLSAKRYEDARRALEQAARLAPHFVDAHFNLAIACYQLGQIEAAAASYRRALEVDPQDARVLNNFGNLLLELGEAEQALEHFENAIGLQPDFDAAHHNRALAWLKLGRFREGWREYQWRYHAPEFAARRHELAPEWDGRELKDKTLLVRGEQGLGDCIQFVRYLPMVRARCTRLLLDVNVRLHPLFAESGIAELVATSNPRPYDVQIALGSLPRIFDTQLESIPADVPYLQAKPELVDSWGKRLAGYEGFKVGIAWQGSPTHREDRNRSIPLECFASLATIPGVRLFSLQKGPGREQISTRRDRLELVDLADEIDEQAGALMDTAAIMKNLDLVIACDTAAIHLAGALGVRAWLALCVGADWRWLTDRADSPWYPTLKLFRQNSFGDWPRVFEDMARELAKLV